MTPTLDLMLTPNRSLDQRHMRWVVGGVGSIFLVGGLRFLALGAWPILPFLLVDVALLFWAFRANTRSGHCRERVTLADDRLTLLRTSPLGAEKHFGFEPLWTRVEIEETPLGDAHVWLTARDRRVRVGGFLSAPERREVAATITTALGLYRSGASPRTASIV